MAGTVWTAAENDMFESLLPSYSDNDHRRWVKMAKIIGTKTAEKVMEHHQRLVQELHAIESRQISPPHYTDMYYDVGVLYHNSDDSDTDEEEEEKPRKTTRRWTEEEHRKFLEGLRKYGWGSWKEITRMEVRTKNAPQVASHAQKHQIRSKMQGNEKRRNSIHDITEGSIQIRTETEPTKGS